ncbi:MAG: tetratricopeptide repeat protein [Candidatus Omnitrophica bacterium]|nr:tetratricopeptide repeat protein [Candidatus Omnitrophota bacterium]
MIEKILKQLSFYLGLVALGILFGFIFQAAQIEIRDLDLWLHLSMGKYIAQTGHIPQADMMSWTLPGKAWIDHEWLFQVVIYHIHNLWGWNGLQVMQGLLVLGVLGLLFFMANDKEKQILVIPLLFVVATILQQRFTVRPDLFSLLFFTVYIYVLSLHIDKKWTLPFLFLVQVVWVNFHGFFFFGPLFILMGIVSEFIKRKVRLPGEWNSIGRLTDEEYRGLKIILGVVVLACFINPYFWRGAGYPVDVLISTLNGQNKVFFQFIQELKRPLASGELFSLHQDGAYKLMILLSAASFFLNRRKIDISALFFWLVFLFFSLSAVRNLVFFAVAAYLVIITNIYQLKASDVIPLTFKKPVFVFITEIAAKVLVILSIFNMFNGDIFRGYYDFDNFKRKSEYGGVSLRDYPAQAVDFLNKNKISGKFFNDFNSGAYLIGRAWPDVKVFIDGRTEFYGKDFFEHYLKVWQKGEPDAIKKYVEDAGATGAFLNSARQTIPKDVLKYFYNSPQWKVVYFDCDAVIFLRDIEQNKVWIKQFGMDLSKWQAKTEDIFQMKAERVRPYRNQTRADTLFSLQLLEPAMAEAKEAMKISPTFYESYYVIGRIYALQKKYEDAYPFLRYAASVAEDNDEVRYDFAQCYYDLKKYDLALKEYQDILTDWPNDAIVHQLMAKVYVQMKKYGDAYQQLETFHKMKPQEVSKVLDVGDLVLEQKAYEPAEQFFKLGRNSGADQDLAHLRLGKLYLAQGKIPQAKTEFVMANKINPENEEVKTLIKENKF